VRPLATKFCPKNKRLRAEKMVYHFLPLPTSSRLVILLLLPSLIRRIRRGARLKMSVIGIKIVMKKSERKNFIEYKYITIVLRLVASRGCTHHLLLLHHLDYILWVHPPEPVYWLSYWLPVG